MKISEVRIKLVNDHREKLRAFCSLTVDDAFAIRDMKIIEISRGLFVAMPSRKLTRRCGRCRTKNHLRASYCNECGARLSVLQLPRNEDGRLRLHADVAYPINAQVRDELHRVVLAAYENELQKAKQPGYRPPVGVFDDEDDEFDQADGWPEKPSSSPPPPPSPPPRPRPEAGASGFGDGIA